MMLHNDLTINLAQNSETFGAFRICATCSNRYNRKESPDYHYSMATDLVIHHLQMHRMFKSSIYYST